MEQWFPSVCFFFFVYKVVTRTGTDQSQQNTQIKKGNMKMKKKYADISNRIKVVGINRMNGNKEVVDYYLINHAGKREYAFTRRYTRNTYDLVKGGIGLKKLLQVKSKDKMTMRLVSYLSMMVPYFLEEIEWMAA